MASTSKLVGPTPPADRAKRAKRVREDDEESAGIKKSRKGYGMRVKASTTVDVREALDGATPHQAAEPDPERADGPRRSGRTVKPVDRYNDKTSEGLTRKRRPTARRRTTRKAATPAEPQAVVDPMPPAPVAAAVPSEPSHKRRREEDEVDELAEDEPAPEPARKRRRGGDAEGELEAGNGAKRLSSRKSKPASKRSRRA